MYREAPQNHLLLIKSGGHVCNPRTREESYNNGGFLQQGRHPRTTHGPINHAFKSKSDDHAGNPTTREESYINKEIHNKGDS